MIKMLIPLGMAAFAGIYILVYYLIDRHLTLKRIVINQREWDEYSKGMSDQEKLDCFNEFLIRQKVKHGWKFMYIPWIGIGGIKNGADN